MADTQAQPDYRNNGMSDEGADVKMFNARRSRSRTPPKRSRSRSRSPRDWKRNERDSKRPRGDGDKPVVNSKRIFVSNIHYETRWMTLKDIFKNEGCDVAYVELHESPDGKPLGTGVVEFKDHETAQKAVEAMHRYEFRGRKLVVREERESDRRRLQRMRDDSGRGGGNQNGPPGGFNDRGGGRMNDGRGGNMGSGMMGGGNVMNPMMGGGMGNAGGMGGGAGLVGALPQVDTCGVPAHVLQQLGIDGPVTCQVFVANLDYKVNEKKVADIFKMAGKIEHAELKLDKDGKSRGMGTVRYSTAMEAVQAISMFNGQILYDRAMSVRMDKMAEPAGTAALPNKLPSGLKSIGMGLGANGLPISDFNQLAPTSMPMNMMGMMGGAGMAQQTMGAGLAGMAGMGAGMGAGMSSNLPGVAGGMGAMGAMGAGMAGMASGMTGMGGMGTGMSNNMGNTGMNLSSSMGGMQGMGMQVSGLQSSSSMGSMGGMQGMGMQGGMSSGMSSGMSDNMGGNRGDGLLGSGSSNLPMPGMMGSMGGGGMGSGSMGGSIMGGGMNSRGSSQPTSQSATTVDEYSSVYVKNIPYNYTWQNLKERFSHIGDVRYAAIKTEHGKSKGCGVVRFSSQDCARRAVQQMHGARVDGRDLVVTLLNRGDRI